MDLTYFSLLAFFITTLIYFYYFKLPLNLKGSVPTAIAVPINKEDTTQSFAGKGGRKQKGGASPSLNDDVVNEGDGSGYFDKYDSYGDYMTDNMSRLLTYFLIIVMEQFGFNLATTVTKCGGTVGKNVAVSLLMTVVPWTLIFGAVIAILIVYPGLKSAFADVIGYFFVYSEADEILGTIIVDTNIESVIDKVGQNVDNKDKTSELKNAAEAIMKMYGNKGILINTMNPENFESIWEVLQPLMSKDIPADKKFEYKTQLFNLIIKKDNIGEAMWYIYTGLLLTSVVSYNLVTRGCEKNITKMQEDHKLYLEKVKKMETTKKLTTAGKDYILTPKN
jgi:hypothetical protein